MYRAEPGEKVVVGPLDVVFVFVEPVVVVGGYEQFM